MTLFKQIALLVSLGFLLLFALISNDNIQRSSVFLKGQLQSSAQDTATVLGMAISTTGVGRDPAALDTLFNAVFNSGYYSRIRLVAADGSVIHERERKLEVAGVPNWFINTIALDSATGSARVQQGWTPLGILELELHPGFAYADLYKNLIHTLWWFLLFFVLVLILLWCVLHMLLRPLQRVSEQAHAIQDNRFVQQEQLPNTVELRRVVQAMNRLVVKVQHIFNDQQSTLSRYEQLLYVDELTGLYNRRFLLAELENVFSDGATDYSVLLVIKVRELEALREQAGYASAEQVLTTFSSLLDAQQGVCARINDDEFAVLASMDDDSADQSIGLLFEQFQSNVDQTLADQVSLAAAICTLHDRRQVGEVLAAVDLALTQAQAAEGYQWRRAVDTELALPQGKIQWRQWLTTMLADNRFYLVAQPAYDRDRQLLHRELFIRVDDANGDTVPAGIFMPMALALGFGLTIDARVFTLLTQLLDDAENDTPLALNLSSAFFHHADAYADFKQLLDACRSRPGLLCVEASYAAWQKYPERCAEVAQAVREAGQRFGIDNLNINSPLQVLQDIRPDYVKVNARFLGDMTGEGLSGAYQALRNLTSTLDVQLIAVGVDEQSLYDTLLQLNIDGVQGNLLGQPESFS